MYNSRKVLFFALLVGLTAASTARAQITLPWNEDFESTNGESYFLSTDTLIGIPDAEYHTGVIQSVGPADNTLGTGDNYTYLTDGLVFDVTNTVVLERVYVYPNSAGDVTVRLLDSSSTVLDTVTVAVSTGGVKTPIDLGFIIPPGTGYQLDASGTTTGGLYRNDAGASYPYSTTGVDITGPINALSGYYYFFYDWEVRTLTSDTLAVGPVDNTIGTGQNYTSLTSGLVFDTTQTVTIDRVYVYPYGPGNVVVNLLDSSSTVLDTATVAVTTTGTKTAINLGFVVPPGTGYRLDASGTTTGGLYRNDSGAAYPYSTTGLDITGSINGLNTYYYFFYDWDVTTLAGGRLRTAAGTGFYHGGGAACTLDSPVSLHDAGNEVIFTLDMTNYVAASDSVELQFWVMRHADEDDTEDAVSIRGSRGDPWINVADLYTETPTSGQYYDVTVDVSAELLAASQDFGSTFQIRLGQYDNYPATSTTASDGYTFDDLSLQIGQYCGNGTVEPGEACDDGNNNDCDGCRGDCSAVETGCGDGFVCGAEACDDGNNVNCDGCRGNCSAVETGCGDGFVCGAEACDDGGESANCNADCTVSVCGDGIRNATAGEACDDHNTQNCDGCRANCAAVETGCGDGFVCGAEACDDANGDNSDACLSTCVAASCGDGFVQVGVEACDDGNGDNHDACLSTCVAASCGDGYIQSGVEGCDDGNTTPGDGCNASCAAETGYTCTGEPSVCTGICGDGIVTPDQGCDDGNTTPGDGCSATCTVEAAWTCEGEPSVCTELPFCGDGNLDTGEVCDDGNLTADDGCNASCQVESGWTCTGEPAQCAPICGDGVILGNEACDDGNTTADDGCSATCTVESGWTCGGEPSVCATVCGDGVVTGAEACDDGNTQGGDGCGATCAVESGWTCTGEPSVCTELPSCGDGTVDTGEACDDGNTQSGDGCDGSCQVETGWSCEGEPSVCTELPSCGDGVLDTGEACDDGNTQSGDGCDGSCQVETNWTCEGEPSVCTPTGNVCGDGVVDPGESCDDGNTQSGDGCSSLCLVESGWTCTGEPSACTEGEGSGSAGCNCATDPAKPSDLPLILWLVGLLLWRRRRA